MNGDDDSKVANITKSLDPLTKSYKVIQYSSFFGHGPGWI